MQNISLSNIIDKTAAKYSTQAKYFTVYDETTRCTLHTLYKVNIEEYEIIRHAILKTKLQQNISLCMKKLQGVHYVLSK